MSYQVISLDLVATQHKEQPCLYSGYAVIDLLLADFPILYGGVCGAST